MKFKVLVKESNVVLQIIGEQSFSGGTKMPKLIAEHLFTPEAATKVGKKLVESAREILEGAKDSREFDSLEEKDLEMNEDEDEDNDK